MSIFLASAVLPFHILLVSAITFYFNNRSEIAFSLYDVWPWLAALFFLSTFFFSLILFFSRKHKMLYTCLSGSLVGLSVCVWLQSQLMVWDFGPLDGRDMEWGKWQAAMLLEGAIWVSVLLFLLFIFLRYEKSKIAILNFAFVVGFFSIASVILSGLLVEKEKKSSGPSLSEAFIFHPQRNVIIILLDTFQSDYFDYIWKIYPDDVDFLLTLSKVMSLDNVSTFGLSKK